MKKHAISLTLSLAIVLGSDVAVHKHHHPEKHTGACKIMLRDGGRVWLMRPNHEIFEAYFDNPPAWMQVGMVVKDLTYTDDNRDTRHFVKAQFD